MATVRLGGQAPGPMPDDGRAYVVIDGKWVEVASDDADGVPSDLSDPPGDSEGGRGGSATTV